MNKLTHNLAAKVIAIFLLVFTIIGFILGTAGIYILAEYNFYESSAANIRREAFEDLTHGYANTVFYGYFPAHRNKTNDLNKLQEAFSSKNTNFLFILKNSDGDIILSNYSNEEYQLHRTYHYEDDIYSYNEADNTNVYVGTDTYTIDCFINKKLNAYDRYLRYDYWINIAYQMRYALIVITIISLIAAIILFIFLMCSAGHRRGEDKVIPNGIDKIPFDILLAVIFTFAFIEFYILTELHSISAIGIIIFLSVFGIIDILLALLVCMGFATRYKLGGWWKNTIIYKFLKFICKTIGRVFNSIKYLFLNIPLMGKTVLFILAISLVEFVVLVSFYDRSTLAFLWLLKKFMLVPAIFFIAIGLRKLQIGGEKIAAGDLSYHIDTKYMFWDFKRHGHNLNSISSGMSKAVDERMKSERFKTELITNVSHDIKTPLTSIINYVDLIKKEDIDSETLEEYVSVLDRQSARLKKLIEDLVEASKASTGNIDVNKARTEVGVLLTQTVGEYEGKIKSNGLELILKKPENDVFIMADGRLLWRVFDNLMSNICKYAQPSTRAYLNLEVGDEQAIITFRNISKFPLNITSDELLDRFIRGDSSRNTEGSGLGLSIAKSLTELQNGKLDLYVDGDLFKVVLTFNTIR